MKRTVCLFFLLACTALAQAQNPDPIVPAPASVRPERGVFSMDGKLVIAYGAPADKRIAGLFRDFLKQHYRIDVPVVHKARKKDKVISFSSLAYAGDNQEGYTVDITPSRITVSGRGAGLFYGLQSLMQLFPLHYPPVISISCVRIADSPRYRYRGIMLGDSYHFFPVSFVKKLIDLMATYKLNTLHWHLTDDNGWRIEIKKYPLLTQIGAWRRATMIGKDPDALDGKRYGGYYTQEQVRDIVSYAAQRFITIIPEIEMPGHCSAALVSYPWLGCGGGPTQVPVRWGIYKDIYCPTDTTFGFLEEVLTEVMALFPSHYIHIGGDEVPKDSWKNSAFCQQLMKEKGLKNEQELQSYFIKRIEKFVNSRGRAIIGWDEILEGGLAPNAVVESWRGTKGGIAAARQGHDVIMAPTDHVYFDYLQGSESEEPIAIGGYNPLEKVYAYDPTPAVLSPRQQKHILGVEACIWTEFMPTANKVEYMILPRMLALSEVGWSEPAHKNYVNFSTVRLPRQLARIDTSSVLYRVPEVIGLQQDTLEGGRFSFVLKPPVLGAKIYYTLDGYKPDATTFLYSKPLTVLVPEGQQRVLKVIAITPSGKRSPVTTALLTHATK